MVLRPLTVLVKERILDPRALRMGLYRNHPVELWVPQRVGVLGVPGLLRNFRLSVVCDLGGYGSGVVSLRLERGVEGEWRGSGADYRSKR
jgi:hypothetical protein